MSTAELPIPLDRARLARFCRERGIRRLAFFGSVLRDDFDPRLSDVDVLAEFAPGALRGVGLRYFDYAPELAVILGHKVDLCSQLHPSLRAQVEREALTIYEQALDVMLTGFIHFAFIVEAFRQCEHALGISAHLS